MATENTAPSPNRVFVVVGDDQHVDIRAAFTSRELALNFCRAFLKGPAMEIREVPLDANRSALQAGQLAFYLRIDSDGKICCCEQVREPLPSRTDSTWQDAGSARGLHINCFAADESEAERLAKEIWQKQRDHGNTDDRNR